MRNYYLKIINRETAIMSANPEFPDFSITNLNPTERQIIKFVFRWNKSMLPNTSDIATELNLPPSTVSSTLKRMKETGISNKGSKKSSPRRRNSDIAKLIEWEPHHGVVLTDFGKKVAEHIEHHHLVMVLFFQESLGIDFEEAHQESELLGIVLSCKLKNIIMEKYNFNISTWDKKCICPDDAAKGCVLAV